MIALMLMTLLTVISVGLLSLSQISVRSASGEAARREAAANARLALTLALNELQSQLGDDRRVTADGAILGEEVAQPQLVGVWNSMTTEHLLNPLAPAPDYENEKERGFRKWLISNPDPLAVEDREYVKSPVTANAPYLFTEEADGFDMRAPLVELSEQQSATSGSKGGGAFAWAVTQAATRASLNVTGAEERKYVNDIVEAPNRPSLALSSLLKQPEGGWKERAGKVVTMNQVVLDPGYGLEKAKGGQVNEHYNLMSRGLQVDVVNGGLKTDLSLGFEMTDSEFSSSNWGDVKNPFFPSDEWKQGGNGNEKVVYQSVNSSNNRAKPLEFQADYNPVFFNHYMNIGFVPTFHSLRSHYRLRHHVYQTDAGVTAFQRLQTSPGYNTVPTPRGSETGLTPVLDRILFFMSAWVDSGGVPHLVFTPIVTLWNPYNVAIETEGLVIYPWMDMPFYLNWKTTVPGVGTTDAGSHMSRYMGRGRVQGHGRQAEPYFLCKLTASGSNNVQNNIRMAPGEVRVFIPASTSPVMFNRNWNGSPVSIMMKPSSAPQDFQTLNTAGVYVPLNQTIGGSGITQLIGVSDSVSVDIRYDSNSYKYFVNVEDATRIKTPALDFENVANDRSKRAPILSEIQVSEGLVTTTSASRIGMQGSLLRSKPQPVAILETFHRTAAASTRPQSDIAYTVNPRQRYLAGMVSGSSAFAAGPHYESTLSSTTDFISASFQVTTDGQRSFYGVSNASSSGSDYLSFFDIPSEPMLSLAAFQHADLADTVFSPGYQFGNSWASPYVSRPTAARILRNPSYGGGSFNNGGLGIYDHSYLLNAGLWDSYFLSSVAPEATVGGGGGSAAYDSRQSSITKPTEKVLREWVENPLENPLRNPRHLFYRGGLSNDELVQRLASPEGCRLIAAHLMVDGTFNVNSTDEEAWVAMLSSLRGSEFNTVNVGGGSGSTYDSGENSPFPRMRNPLVRDGDMWNRVRSLTDEQVRNLAKQIVVEVRGRGPFQSLGEFVNRRLTSDEKGLAGALQAAIDRVGLNSDAKIASFDTSGYPYRTNISDASTGVGTPGWLTQADLLTGLGPFLSVRSDTFTVRAYGESRDAKGKVQARCLIEAVVQRVPEWVDEGDDVTDVPADLTPVSARFGRRFEVVSLREVSRNEVSIAGQASAGSI